MRYETQFGHKLLIFAFGIFFEQSTRATLERCSSELIISGRARGCRYLLLFTNSNHGLGFLKGSRDHRDGLCLPVQNVQVSSIVAFVSSSSRNRPAYRRQATAGRRRAKQMTNLRVPLKRSDGREQWQNPCNTKRLFSARDSSHI